MSTSRKDKDNNLCIVAILCSYRVSRPFIIPSLPFSLTFWHRRWLRLSFLAERLIQKEQAQGLCQGAAGTGLDTISSPKLISFGWEGCFLLSCPTADWESLVRKEWRSWCGAWWRSPTTSFLLGEGTVMFVLLQDRTFSASKRQHMRYRERDKECGCTSEAWLWGLLLHRASQNPEEFLWIAPLSCLVLYWKGLQTFSSSFWPQILEIVFKQVKKSLLFSAFSSVSLDHCQG